jgi:hypothetical protein
MNESLLQYGVAVVVIVVVLRLVLDFLLSLKQGRNGMGISSPSMIIPGVSEHCRRCDARMDIMAKNLDKLWDIHDKYNEDGSPKWFVPQKLLSDIHADLVLQYKCQKDMLGMLKEHGTLDKAAVMVATERYTVLSKSVETGIEKMKKLVTVIEALLRKLDTLDTE